jgi:hypothetical protein
LIALLQDCKEHRQEIFTKVVMIMKDRAEVHSQGIAVTTPPPPQ